MNKTKEAYKLTIVNFILDLYMELHDDIAASQGCVEEHILNQDIAALKFMKNLMKTITAETDAEIEERIRNYNRPKEENDA